jgi:hypothetical protein
MSQSTSITRVESTGEVIAPPFALSDYLATIATDRALAEQQQLAHAYDVACASLIGPNDVQVEGSRSFKKKSAWRKLARYFGISTSIVKVEREWTAGGDFLATVTVRAAAPWGQSAEAVGACGTDEATGRRTISTADAIATAETRATNRAVSNLVAMGEVSAEEIGDRKAYDSAPRTREAAPPVRQVAAAPLLAQAEKASAKYIEHAGQPQAGPDNPPCPKCGGPMWDDRQNKRNPNAPDFKCKNKPKAKGEPGCEGVIWPPKNGAPSKPAAAPQLPAHLADDFAPFNDGDGDIPF